MGRRTRSKVNGVIPFWVLLVAWSCPVTGVARPARLPVAGYAAAAYVAPTVPGKRPVVVGLHGNFDRPQWFCEAMQDLVRGRAWLLCPRGSRRRDVPRQYDRWTFPSRSRLRREIKAGLLALERRFPGRVDPVRPLLAGFSLGAIYAARFAVAQPARFPRLYLVEGSQRVWTAKNVRRFARGGGQRVVFGCGRKGCGARSRRICKILRARKLRCAEATVPRLGHSYVRPLTTLALPLFRAMLAEDARFGAGGGAASRAP